MLCQRRCLRPVLLPRETTVDIPLGGTRMYIHERDPLTGSPHGRPARRRPPLRVREGGRRAGARRTARASSPSRPTPSRRPRRSTFDPAVTSVEELRALGRGLRLPLRRPVGARPRLRPAGRARPPDRTTTPRSSAPTHAHGHGHGGHAGMSMEAMARDMRNRFLVALVFTIPIVAWSTVGTKLLGTRARRRRSASTATSGSCCSACRSSSTRRRSSSRARVAALRARTLDMMVLVAVAIGTGWLYSVAATFFIEGEVFYEAAAHARHLRAARPLVRDARPRRRQRRDPRAARPGAAEGRRPARRRARRGPDRRGRRSATCC